MTLTTLPMGHQPSPPPTSRKKFLAAVGVKAARFLPGKPPFIRRGKAKGRYAVGLRYERQVHELLELHCLGKAAIDLKLGPWIEFEDKNGRRWCQPDAVLLNRSQRRALIAEIKYQHTVDAWWQLRHLYSPVLAYMFPDMDFSLVEIVHWFDPLVAWPETPVLIRSLDQVPHDSNLVAVHICNPNRRAQF